MFELNFERYISHIYRYLWGVILATKLFDKKKKH